MKIRKYPSGKRRISYRLGRGLWISEDPDQDLRSDPSGRLLCALLMAVVAAMLACGLLRGFQLPIPNEEFAAAGVLGALIAFPFTFYIDWRVNRLGFALRHILYGGAGGALIAFLAGAPS